MLQLKNIHKQFGDNHVLKGVDISVGKGDVVVILGPSGSGKTTFLRSINFLERADAGEIIFQNKTIETKTATKKEIHALRQKIAFVFQNYNLFQHKTA